jgi:integrase
VFTAPLGGPLRWSKWIDAFYKPALRAAGLPSEVRLYDLRHTCASLLTREGASIKAVQAQMGHATASITLDTYGHLFPDELPALADRLEHARTAALDGRRRGEVWPHSGPSVVPIRESAGQ